MNDVWQMWARLRSSCLTFGKHRAIHAVSWAQVGRSSRWETVPTLPAFHKPPINLSSRSRLGLTKQAVWSKAALQAPIEDEYVYACILCTVLHAKIIVTLSNTNLNWFHYSYCQSLCQHWNKDVLTCVCVCVVVLWTHTLMHCTRRH